MRDTINFCRIDVKNVFENIPFTIVLSMEKVYYARTSEQSALFKGKERKESLKVDGYFFDVGGGNSDGVKFGVGFSTECSKTLGWKI